MPSKKQGFYDTATGTMKSRPLDTDEDQSNAAVAGRSTAGLGSLEKGTAGMPKQKEGESLTSFSARMRKYREEHNSVEATARRKALASE